MSHAEAFDLDSGILDITFESFDRHYAVNVRATWLLLASFARQLTGSAGFVVALTSDHTVGNLPYGVTKGALDRRRDHWPAARRAAAVTGLSAADHATSQKLPSGSAK